MPLIPISMKLATLAVEALVLASQFHFAWLLRGRLRAVGVRAPTWWALAAFTCGLALTLYSSLFLADIRWLGASREPTLLRLAAGAWAAGSAGAYGICLTWFVWTRLREIQRPERLLIEDDADRATGLTRRQALATTVGSLPYAAAGYGVFIGRDSFELREIELLLADLPPDLDGLRVAQLTDIHYSLHLTAKELRRVVAMANETKPHVAVLTGDLVTAPGDPVEECLDILGGLRADAGVLGCLGNHEIHARCQRLAQAYAAGRGIRFLRRQTADLRFGDARLNFAGVDYQRQRSEYLAGADQMVMPGAFNVLLSHNPDVFPVAADQGYNLVVSGHTHGGQVTVEIVEQTVNAGRFFTPFVVGEYRLGKAALYVSRGVGTVQLPMRIGALPEVTLLKLRRA